MPRIAAHITGTVSKIEKREGDPVEPGEVLCKEGESVEEGQVLMVLG